MFIVWDYDGVMVDSFEAVRTAYSAVCDLAGVDHPDDATMRSFIGPPLSQAITRLMESVDRGDEAEAACQLYVRTYCNIAPQLTVTTEGMHTLLAGLHLNDVRMAIATMKPWEEINGVSTSFPFLDQVDLICAPQFNRDSARKSQLVADAVAQIRNDDRGFMIGDRASDITAGLHQGLTTVGVLWGYGDEAELRNANAHHVVKTVDELREVLR